jgi:hypothetical protein
LATLATPDSDRGHANNEPSKHGPPTEFGVGNNPDVKADYLPADITYAVSVSMLDIQAKRRHFVPGES